MGQGRTFPPLDLIEGEPETFVPSPDLAAWARATFIDPAASLANSDHEHLNEAEIGFLWTDIPNSRATRSIAGQAELGTPVGAMGKWAKARALMQVREWFGDVPDFIITLEASYAASCDDASFCALVEHELYHCAPERDAFGAPKFTRDGRPKFAMRGHDVEEFVGVVARYGIAASGVGDLVRAANKGPTIAEAGIAGACGTCLARLA